MSDPSDSQEAVLRFLADPAAHGWIGTVARVENAIVFLAGPEGEDRVRARALARDYFDRAVGFLRFEPPRLVCVGGLSGAGKSALAGALSPHIGRAPGALWLRSDVERKAIFGVDEVARLPDSAMRRQARSRVYRRIEDKARRALKAAQAVVLDATFSAAREREAVARIAAKLGVAFVGLFLEAPLEARLARVPARRADVSDADASVARWQRAEPLYERGWSPLDASASLDSTAGSALRRIGVDPLSGVGYLPAKP